MTAALGAYASVWSLHLRNTLVKRVDHLSSIATGLLLAYALAFLWRTLYENGIVPAGVPLDQMVTYAILGSVLSTAFQTDIVFSTAWRVRTGDIVIDLARPIWWQFAVMAEFMGIGVAQLLVLAVPIVVISAVLLGMAAPASSVAAALFFPSVILGLVINFGIVFLIILLAFEFTEVGGFEYAVRGLRPLLTGAFVPLWLFPVWVRGTLEASPFPSIYFAPLSIYVGVVEGTELWLTLVRQIAWAVGLTLAGAFLSHRIFRRLAAQGG